VAVAESLRQFAGAAEGMHGLGLVRPVVRDDLAGELVEVRRVDPLGLRLLAPGGPRVPLLGVERLAVAERAGLLQRVDLAAGQPRVALGDPAVLDVDARAAVLRAVLTGLSADGDPAAVEHG